MKRIFDDPACGALVLVDLQNDFLHPDGAYARGGAAAKDIADLPARLKPVVDAVRRRSGWIVSTHFTLVPGRDGEPMISSHLKSLRPFLGKGDFAPGSFGHALIDELGPADLAIDKVAYSAFYMSRMEWVLRRAGITRLAFAGIVTNGGVAASVRDAHVRDFDSAVISDGCAAFRRDIHDATILSLSSVVGVTSCAQILADLS